MKTYLKNVIIIITASLFITSCEVEDTTGDSILNYTAPTITITASDNNINLSEASMAGSQTYTITASIPDPVAMDLVVDVAQASGTATAGFDFEFDQKIVIYSGQTSAEGLVTVHKTGDAEGDEDFSLSFNASANANINDFTFQGTISDDYINDNLQITFAWCSDYSIVDGATTITGNYGEAIDIDIVTSPAIGGAATGDCPEVLEFGGLADGEYLVAIQVWDNQLSDNGWDQNVPIEISYSQEYVLDGSTPVAHNVVLNSDTGSGIIGIALRVTKTGYNFVVEPF